MTTRPGLRRVSIRSMASVISRGTLPDSTTGYRRRHGHFPPCRRAVSDENADHSQLLADSAAVLLAISPG
jgi:hypothetical protein